MVIQQLYACNYSIVLTITAVTMVYYHQVAIDGYKDGYLFWISISSWDDVEQLTRPHHGADSYNATPWIFGLIAWVATCLTTLTL